MKKSELTPKIIKEHIEDYFNICLVERNRKLPAPYIRYLYFYYAYKYCFDYGLIAIGKELKRSHATVLHGIRFVTQNINYNRLLRDQYERMQECLNDLKCMNLEKTRQKQLKLDNIDILRLKRVVLKMECRAKYYENKYYNLKRKQKIKK